MFRHCCDDDELGLCTIYTSQQPCLWVIQLLLKRTSTLSQKEVSAQYPRSLPSSPWLGLYALMPLASFSPYQPNDDHWAAAILANTMQRPVSCIHLRSARSFVGPLRELDLLNALLYNNQFTIRPQCSNIAATFSPISQDANTTSV